LVQLAKAPVSDSQLHLRRHIVRLQRQAFLEKFRRRRDVVLPGGFLESDFALNTGGFQGIGPPGQQIAGENSLRMAEVTVLEQKFAKAGVAVGHLPLPRRGPERTFDRISRLLILAQGDEFRNQACLLAEVTRGHLRGAGQALDGPGAISGIEMLEGGIHRLLEGLTFRFRFGMH
jgi:hypothetical protein